MRATVLHDVGRMEVRDVPRPVAGPDDVLIAVDAVGLCGTDFHIFSGESNYNLDERGREIPLSRHPQILGHEIVGVVREVGAGVGDLVPGDRVVVDQGLNCTSAKRATHCEYCSTGDTHQCEGYVEHGITGLPGGLAEYLALPAVNAVRLESNLTSAHAALTEPLACVLHSSERAERATARYSLHGADSARRVRTAVILGAGPAGLLFTKVLRRVLGFDGTLVVADPDPGKRALAEGLGAITVDPHAVPVEEAVLEHSAGRRAEYLIEASGSGAVFETLPALIRKQATVLLYGIGHGGASLELLNQVQWKEPTVVLSVGASGGFDPDGRPSIYRRALRLIEGGDVGVERLVTHQYEGLDAVPSAFERPLPTGYVKGVAVLAR